MLEQKHLANRFHHEVNSKIFFIQKLVFEYFTCICKVGEKVE